MHKSAVIIIHFGSLSNTKRTLSNLKKKIRDHKLILINNTQQDIANLTKIIPNTSLIQNSANLGFAKAVNQGIIIAFQDKSVDNIMLMNNDLILTFGTLEMLAKTLFSLPNVGIVSPVLKHSGNLYDWGGKVNKWLGIVKHQNFAQRPKKVLEVDHVAGAAMMIKRSMLEDIGYFDETFFLYFEDLDFSLRAKQAGYKILIDPEIVADHDLSSSSNPIQRIFYQWQSHIKLLMKHLPKTILPTAFLYDTIVYPLILLKTLLSSAASKRQ